MFLSMLWKILGGVSYTLGFALFAFVFGFIFGLFMAVQRCFYNGVFSYLLQILSSLIRGTPIIVQSYLSIYIFSCFLEYNPKVIVLSIVLVVNSSCYLSEILLSSFRSIPKIQYDVANILNFSKEETIKYIILPQTLINSKNLIVNELTNLVKETSIVSFVGIADIMWRARTIITATYEIIVPMMIVGMIYYTINIIFENIIGLWLFRLLRLVANLIF